MASRVNASGYWHLMHLALIVKSTTSISQIRKTKFREIKWTAQF